MKLAGITPRVVTNTLTAEFGFQIRDSTGGHEILRGMRRGVETVTIAVPSHRYVNPLTLAGILKTTDIPKEVFLEAVRRH
jgi:predicted RNA binding protein YcfA (HicA-like mRNA interferase family)